MGTWFEEKWWLKTSAFIPSQLKVYQILKSFFMQRKVVRNNNCVFLLWIDLNFSLSLVEWQINHKGWFILPWVALIMEYPLSPVTERRSSETRSWGARSWSASKTVVGQTTRYKKRGIGFPAQSILSSNSCNHLREESQVKIVFFFVAYLPDLAADPNKKKYAVFILDIKNVVACQISV